VSAGFIHLRLHTEYSLSDGLVRVPELMGAVAEAGMPAVALTDQCNLFAMVKFYRAALERGIQPIIGADLLVREPEEPARPSRLTLLCQNLEGYRNLARLVSRMYLEGQTPAGQALIDRGWLGAGESGGLIALSGAAEGDIGRALLRDKPRQAEQALEQWLALFGDRFYLELQRLGRPEEHSYLPAALSLAARRSVPVVATNDVRFLRPADFEAHEARVCIHDGTLLADPSRPRRYTGQQYLRTPEEMRTLFADVPEALENTVQIARRCSLMLKLGQPRLPDYPVPAGGGTPAEYLREQSRAGLAQRLAALPAGEAGRYQARLATELEVICAMGFAGYFLIVADFIRWSREHGVPVGPGRGSGAGSLVAYALGITDIDPLGYDLLFERFLNPERVSMPDFDVDFCMEGRDRVIDYVAEKYGHDRVSQIITYGTMAAKAVVRDVGRVLGHPYGFVDRIAKLIPFELGITLDDAIGKEPELKRLYDEDEEVRNLWELARSLEGITRNAGKHAGGVVIAPSVLTDFTPLFCEPGGANLITQFDKDDVEAVGLVKFDFLGLRTLTILDWAMQTINAERARRGEPALRLGELPMDDAATYALLKSCRTTAVFQFESRGMKDLIRRLQPDHFEDLVAINALFRPGPLQSGMVDDFINRKHGRIDGPIDYLHPSLEPVLKPTYGVILYQEQVMQIAQVLAGYTLGGADLLRRAMGKKKPEEMAKQRSVFVEGARSRGVAESIATHIFDLMEKFAGYGFNKSHSAAYALLSYQTAYLKAYYPAAFMAAVLSADMDHTDKIVTLIDECKAINLTVLPPDVNASQYAFTVSDERTIRYGLGAIKGLGRSAVDAIVEQREAGGVYHSLAELCRRIDLSRVNRRALEALLRAGALDSLGLNRATLMASLDSAVQAGEQAARSHEAGQVDLFGVALASGAQPAGEPAGAAGAGAGGRAGASALSMAPPPTLLPEWSVSQRLAGERETLGLYLSGHPFAPYEPDLRFFASGRIAEFLGERAPPPGERSYADVRTVTIAGLVLEVRRRGPRVAFMLDDRSGRMEVSLFEEVYQRYRDLVVKDALLQVEGALRFDDFSDAWRLAGKQISSLASVRERLARALVVEWPEGADPSTLPRLEALLRASRGGQCSVLVRYRCAGVTGTLSCAEDWKVHPTPQLLEDLEGLLGAGAVRLRYANPAAVTAMA
jgi:DNA polymerase-3 subunit alpha